jgi:hypothetical protein
MGLPDYILSFLADVVGVLLGAWLGYMFGLRQQRRIDNERAVRMKRELKDALKNELVYMLKELGDQPGESSEVFSELAFNPVFLDLPTFTSIVNSGQLLLLDAELVRSLRELNTEVHEHNIAQAAFLAVNGAMDAAEFASHLAEFKRILAGKDEKPNGRLGSLLNVVLGRRETIVREAQELIKSLSDQK